MSTKDVFFEKANMKTFSYNKSPYEHEGIFDGKEVHSAVEVEEKL